MSGLTITLDLPKKPVLSGENFLATIKVKNAEDSDVEGPPKFPVENSFEFQLAPVNGLGEIIYFSQDAKKRRSPPGLPYVEENFPPPKVETETYKPGEEIVETVYPARLAGVLFPAGEYNLSVSFKGHGGVVLSAVAPLVVMPSHVESYQFGVRGMMGGVDLIFVDRGPDGRAFLFHGSGDADTPTDAPGLRVADLGEPDSSGQMLQTSVARVLEDDGHFGGTWCSWLKPDGIFAASIAYGGYIAGTTGSIDLKLKNSSLLPYGWQDRDSDALVTFAALGKGNQEMELVQVAVDPNKQWSAEISRTPLRLPTVPNYWRMIPIKDQQEYILVATVEAEEETHVYSIDVGNEGGIQNKPLLLAGLKGRVLAIAVPYLILSDSKLHILTMDDQSAEKNHLVLHHFNLIGGDSKTESLELNGLEMTDCADGQWAISADSLILTGLIGGRLIAYKLGADKKNLDPIVLRESVIDGKDLELVKIGRISWALWRESSKGILSQPIL